LRHAEIGLADAADLAVRPLLSAEPFDDVVEVFLLVAIEQAEFAARLAAAAHVHVGVDVAVLQIEIDRAGLAPEKLRRRRQRIVVVAVRRRRQQHRKAALAFRHIERNHDLHAVMDADFSSFLPGVPFLTVTRKPRASKGEATAPRPASLEARAARERLRMRLTRSGARATWTSLLFRLRIPDQLIETEHGFAREGGGGAKERNGAAEQNVLEPFGEQRS